MSIPELLPDLLINAAKNFPYHGVGYVRPNGSIHFDTYPELLDKAKRILQGFYLTGVTKGDKIILSLTDCEEIIPIIWACFIGSIVPALLQPPFTFTEYNPAAEKAQKIYKILQDPWVILSHEHLKSWSNSGIPESRLLDVLALSREHPVLDFPEQNPDDLALIQFSSGSTGDPKGVMLSHRNIIINTADIITGLEMKPEDVITSWMPLYHDMGLIGFHISPLHCGASNYLINTMDFVKNPPLWLDMMSEIGTSISGCPNFGQMLVNRSVKRRKQGDWDLSHLRVVFNAAEPISVPIMSDFIHNLSEFNLRPEAMFPAYGLAEATLAVTFAPLEEEAGVIRFQRISLLRDGLAVVADQEDDNVIELVNLGRPLLHCRVKITNDSGADVGERVVGSVKVSGENASVGYYRNREVTEQTFQDGWLHTGDLGFLLNGDLFIMGRLKDVIFVNGINFYAHDLETVTHSIEGIISGKVVIAGYFDEKEGRDKLLIFLVGSDNEATRETFLKIRNHLKNTLGLHPDTFIPIRSKDIPRTSSGKIQRYKMVNRFLQGEFSSGMLIV